MVNFISEIILQTLDIGHESYEITSHGFEYIYTAKSRSQKSRHARGFDPHHLTLPYLTLNRVGKGTLLTNAEPPESPMNLSEITWMLLKPCVSFRKTMREYHNILITMHAFWL